MGLDKDLFEGDIDPEVICKICGDVFDDPVANTCPHVFCFRCIQNRLTHESSRVCPICQERLDKLPKRPSNELMQKWENLRIKCPNSCEEYLPLHSLENHVRDCCPKTKLDCLNSGRGCNEKISREDLRTHLCKFCLYRYVRCEGCGMRVLYYDVFTHQTKTKCMEVKLRQEVMRNRRTTHRETKHHRINLKVDFFKTKQDERNREHLWFQEVIEARKHRSRSAPGSARSRSSYGGSVYGQRPSSETTPRYAMQSPTAHTMGGIYREDHNDFSPFKISQSSMTQKWIQSSPLKANLKKKNEKKLNRKFASEDNEIHVGFSELPFSDTDYESDAPENSMTDKCNNDLNEIDHNFEVDQNPTDHADNISEAGFIRPPNPSRASNYTTTDFSHPYAESIETISRPQSSIKPKSPRTDISEDERSLETKRKISNSNQIHTIQTSHICKRCNKRFRHGKNTPKSCHWHKGPIVNLFGGVCQSCGHLDNRRGCLSGYHVADDDNGAKISYKTN